VSLSGTVPRTNSLNYGHHVVLPAITQTVLLMVQPATKVNLPLAAVHCSVPVHPLVINSSTEHNDQTKRRDEL